MFRSLFLSASLAGLFAALALTLIQYIWITPLILKAEVYEDAAETAKTSSAESVAHTHDDAAEDEHHHHDEEWKPHDGLERTLFTLAGNIVMGLGYALVLIGIYNVWREPTPISQNQSVAQGLLFGLAGFVVFFAAPGLGLPPELPGTKAAALGARQQWWIVTALSTAVGLMLLFLRTKNNWLLRILGIAIIIAPHIIGAPHLAVEVSLAPEELQTQFRLATALANAAFWLLLGAVSVFAVQKFSISQLLRE